jgi:N-methylhydantoinase A
MKLNSLLNHYYQGIIKRRICMKIGIDVGGTFTDFLLTADDGTSEIYKVLSTPDDPSIGVMNGLSEMAKNKNMELNDFIKKVETIVHGTTVTTNAVLTYNGAKTGLLTTKGVRDALEMRRGIREEQYNNRYTNVKPLVSRYLRLPIEERLDYSGAVVTPLNISDVEKSINDFKSENVNSIAVCYMNSFANSEHEKKTAEFIKQNFPDTYLTVSSTFLPSIRFYDRVSSTVLNSYVGPILKNYLTSLKQKLSNIGFYGILLIMQSNGGVISPEIAINNAAATLLSGPAGGPVAGIIYSEIQGYNDCITVDMGGTSFDAALIRDKTPLITTEGEINRFRLALPMLNIVTIGAGGGSIGWIDEGGLLHMGPQSAGAKPGPVCYDRGGTKPACTDADLILGYLDKDYFAGGKIKLNYDKAKEAIIKDIAKPLNLDLIEAAAGMYNVINVNMAAGVREVSVKRGEDPRDFPMVIAGGAGPIHACMIAHELEIPIMIVPKESSIFCAAGMLMSDLKHDFVRTYSIRLDQMDDNKFKTFFNEMVSEAERMLATENIPEERREFIYSLDLRYLKQYHEVNILISREDIDSGNFETMAAKFHPEHNRLFGYSLEEDSTPLELINLRLTALGKTEKPRFSEEKYASEDPKDAFKHQREAYIPSKKDMMSIPVYDGFKLKFGHRILGPAIIEQVNTTTFVTNEYAVAVDRFGSYTLYLKSRESEFLDKALGNSLVSSSGGGE